MNISLHDIEHSREMKTKTYVEIIAFICLTLFGVECFGLSVWYFVKRSENPYHVLQNVPLLAILIMILIVTISIVLARLTIHVMVQKSVEQRNSLPQANSFIEFLKMSPMWAFILVFIVLIPLIMTRAILSALNAPAGIARAIASIGMVHFLGLSLILTFIGLGGLVFTVMKLLRINKTHLYS